MTIRRYQNYKNKKEAFIIQGDGFFIVETYQFGEFRSIEDYKSFQTAQKEAIKYINE